MSNFQLNFLSNKEISISSERSLEQWGNNSECNDGWKEEYKRIKKLKEHEIKLLDKGAQSQSQAWLINKMWSEWKELTKVNSLETNPKIKRSSKEWEKAFIEWKQVNDNKQKNQSSLNE